ncbi:MAG: iron ABC transporter permease [Candidatus Marinimicrobia bacterium]|nr:iron ABC transporter permease [Candidatus Neomarinimicrobiota bacterium]
MNKKYEKNTIIFLIGLFLLAIISLVSTTIGPVKISILQIIDILFESININTNLSSSEISQAFKTVVIDIRLPRILMGIIVGIALGISGAILQGLFRNPLIDPGFIGVSSGAAIGAMFVIMFSQLIAIENNFYIQFLLPVFAMSGGLSTTILVYKMSQMSGKTNIMAMLLSGIAVNAFSGSIIGFLVYRASDMELRSFTFWTLGSLDNSNWLIVSIAVVAILIPIIISINLRKKLDIFMLGDAEAGYLGLNIEKLKKRIIFISALMVGVTVAFCGMIGFIGLVTPHLVRLIMGPSHKTLIFGSAILGAIILILADFISRIIIAPAQLPIGIITSALGAPFFLWLIVSQKQKIRYEK